MRGFGGVSKKTENFGEALAPKSLTFVPGFRAFWGRPYPGRVQGGFWEKKVVFRGKRGERVLDISQTKEF